MRRVPGKGGGYLHPQLATVPGLHFFNRMIANDELAVHPEKSACIHFVLNFFQAFVERKVLAAFCFDVQLFFFGIEVRNVLNWH